MAEGRLSGFSIISNENKRALQLNEEEVIDMFAQIKTRKINF